MLSVSRNASSGTNDRTFMFTDFITLCLKILLFFVYVLWHGLALVFLLIFILLAIMLLCLMYE